MRATEIRKNLLTGGLRKVLGLKPGEEVTKPIKGDKSESEATAKTPNDSLTQRFRNYKRHLGN